MGENNAEINFQERDHALEQIATRLGAVTGLVLGLFVGLTFLPLPLTGPVGKYIGHGLWRMLGAGALGIPLLGIGLALAGFDRPVWVSLRSLALRARAVLSVRSLVLRARALLSRLG